METTVTQTSLTGTQHIDWAPALLGESLLFGLLGKVLYSNPARDWVESLAAESLFDEAPFAAEQESTQRGLALLNAWSETVGRDGLTDEMLSDLRVDYTRLFVGQRRMEVPPWESVYFSMERLTFQEETVDVRRWYKQFGVQPNVSGKEPEDHIAFELSFAGHLAGQAVSALEADDEATFNSFLNAQREFLADHLLRWGWKWAELALDYAHTDFYKGLALLVQGALNELSAMFELPIDREARFLGLGF
jgi:TorA maturation chaperone TorD